jgi:hypothetical protein
MIIEPVWQKNYDRDLSRLTRVFQNENSEVVAEFSELANLLKKRPPLTSPS